MKCPLISLILLFVKINCGYFPICTLAVISIDKHTFLMFWQVELTSVLLHVSFALHSTKSCQQPLWELSSASLRLISINYLGSSSRAVCALRTKFQNWFFATLLGPEHFAGPPKKNAPSCHLSDTVTPITNLGHLSCPATFSYSIYKSRNCASEGLPQSLSGSFLSNKFLKYTDLSLISCILQSMGAWWAPQNIY